MQYASSSYLHSNHGTSTIRTAVGAQAVWQHGRLAGGAAHRLDGREALVRAPFSSSGFTVPFTRNRHDRSTFPCDFQDSPLAEHAMERWPRHRDRCPPKRFCQDLTNFPATEVGHRSRGCGRLSSQRADRATRYVDGVLNAFDCRVGAFRKSVVGWFVQERCRTGVGIFVFGDGSRDGRDAGVSPS